ncbi:hypothetical protein T484DRAFT_1903113 [Baffinella frigidus]|nr:hypothetical protein T484DRAFT_1903113 [Cryptophyta sp. CCMP2293]
MPCWARTLKNGRSTVSSQRRKTPPRPRTARRFSTKTSLTTASERPASPSRATSSATYSPPPPPPRLRSFLSSRSTNASTSDDPHRHRTSPWTKSVPQAPVSHLLPPACAQTPATGSSRCRCASRCKDASRACSCSWARPTSWRSMSSMTPPSSSGSNACQGATYRRGPALARGRRP